MLAEKSGNFTYVTKTCMCRYEKSDEDEDVDHNTQASFWKNIQEILIQIFNFRRLKSPTTLSGGIVAWEVFFFCEYMVCSSALVYFGKMLLDLWNGSKTFANTKCSCMKIIHVILSIQSEKFHIMSPSCPLEPIIIKGYLITIFRLHIAQ